VSVYALSKSLMLPYETTRRHAQRLLDRGLVRRAASGGLYIPADVVTRPEIVEGMSDAADLALTYLSQLARYGVVARAPAPGPA
jgi:DNA-binding IclR family transcriptional regulator